MAKMLVITDNARGGWFEGVCRGAQSGGTPPVLLLGITPELFQVSCPPALKSKIDRSVFIDTSAVFEKCQSGFKGRISAVFGE